MKQTNNVVKFIECLMSNKPTSAKVHLKQAIDERIKQKIINNNSKGLF